MNKDVSIILPSIRPENLERFYESAEKACKNNSFEIIIPSPYLIPESLMKKGNVKFLHTYSNPVIAFQMAVELAQGEFIYNVTDDGLIQENSIDAALDLSKAISAKDSINMVYDEGVLDINTLELKESNHSHFPEEYWYAWTHPDLRLPGINQSWKLCIHFFMKTSYFIELGGYDCDYEYSNHAIHDLAFRMQQNGGQVHILPQIAFYCSHGHDDHKPIEEAQLGPDLQRFNSIYLKPEAAASRIYIRYDNWKSKDSIWKRRFRKDDLKIRKDS